MVRRRYGGSLLHVWQWRVLRVRMLLETAVDRPCGADTPRKDQEGDKSERCPNYDEDEVLWEL